MWESLGETPRVVYALAATEALGKGKSEQLKAATKEDATLQKLLNIFQKAGGSARAASILASQAHHQAL